MRAFHWHVSPSHVHILKTPLALSSLSSPLAGFLLRASQGVFVPGMEGEKAESPLSKYPVTFQSFLHSGREEAGGRENQLVPSLLLRTSVLEELVLPAFSVLVSLRKQEALSLPGTGDDKFVDSFLLIGRKLLCECVCVCVCGAWFTATVPCLLTMGKPVSFCFRCFVGGAPHARFVQLDRTVCMANQGEIHVGQGRKITLLFSCGWLVGETQCSTLDNVWL